MQKPKVVAITRPLKQVDEITGLIVRCGWQAYLIPTIEIRSYTDSDALRKFVADLIQGKVDYVIFMSVNGVDKLLEASNSMHLEKALLDCLKDVRILPVGPKTAERISLLGLSVELIPEEFSSTGIVECLRREGVRGKTICIPRSKASDPTLKRMLMAEGAFVQEIYVYDVTPPSEESRVQKFISDMRTGKINGIIFSSSSTVKGLFEMVEPYSNRGEIRKLLNCCTVVAIGPVTKATLVKHDVQVHVTPSRYTLEDSIKALQKYWEG